jgi:protease I
MAGSLQGRKIAFLATTGVEQVEYTEPRKAVEQAGAEAELISLQPGKIEAWNHFDMGDSFAVDKTVDEVNADDYDGLVLPGGVANPDQLRINPKAVAFTRAFFESGKPVGVICHGPWTMIDADVVRGRTITSWPSLRTDLRNAGANWVDEECVNDAGLVSSRKPDDLPAFCAKIVEEFAEGVHGQQAAKTAANR